MTRNLEDAAAAIREGLVAKLGLPQDAAHVTVRDPEDGPPVSEEHRVEGALYVTAVADGYGQTAWIGRHMLDDRGALVALGDALAYDISKHRSDDPHSAGEET